VSRLSLENLIKSRSRSARCTCTVWALLVYRQLM